MTPSVPTNRPRAIITGIAGFTGPHLARLLLRHGLEVVGLDRACQQRGVSELAGRVEVLAVDLRDAVALESVMSQLRPDYIFHLACLRGSADLTELWTSNVLATDNLLRAAAAHAPHAKIFVPGSAAEVGHIDPGDLPIRETQPLRPLSPYGLTKAAQIMRVMSYRHTAGLQVYVGRTFNLVGPDEPDSMVCSAIASQIAAIERGRRPSVVRVAHTESERDFLDIRDAVQAYWAITSRGRVGELYNVCGGHRTSVGNILEHLVSLSAVPVTVQIAAGIVRRDDVPLSVGDPRKLREQTGWRAEIPLKDSLAAMLETWRKRAAMGHPMTIS